jgi:hypothetical protein
MDSRAADARVDLVLIQMSRRPEPPAPPLQWTEPAAFKPGRAARAQSTQEA